MTVAALAGLCVWGFLLYSNTLKAPFLFDDEEFILKNPVIRQLGDPALWQDPSNRKRFVAFSTFALNYRVHGNGVTGYHIVNLAIHLFTALSVVWFLLLLFKTPRMREDRITKRKYVIAFLIGGLFVSHPIQTEAVTYLSQRFECLAALFYMLSLCLYLKGRMSPRHPLRSAFFFMLSAVAAVLGAFTKETLFTLPALLVLIEWVFLKEPDPNSFSKERVPIWKKPWLYIGAVFLLMTATFFSLSLDLQQVFSAHAKIGITGGTYLLTQFRVILKYIGLLFLPLRQNLDYDFPWSPGLVDGPTLSSILLLLVVLFLAFRSIRRFPLIGFGVIWFFLTLSVTSSFIPLKDAMMEHRLYLPSVGFSIAFCAGIFYGIKNFRVFLLSMFGVIFVFSFLTYRRNEVWTDDLRLWKDVISQSPYKARPYVNLGVAYRRRGEYQKAVNAYQTALKLRPEHREPLAQIYNNLGAIYGIMKNYPQEIYFCRKAAELDSRNYQAQSNLGYAYALVGDYENALIHGREAVKMAPRFDEGWNNLGVTYGLMGRYEEAAGMFRKALEINPDYGEAAANQRLARDLIKGR